jgi:hypothetical protein
MKTVIEDYHRTRTVLDVNYIESLFIKQEREFLVQAQQRAPNSIIRTANSALIASGISKGIGGSIPANWDGSTIQL